MIVETQRTPFGKSALLAILLIVGCGVRSQAARGAERKDGAKAREDRAGSPPSPEPSKPAADASQNNYLIGPEDVLAVNVWHEPEISRAIPVRPDGKISLPLVGEVEAKGLTPAELRSAITEKLKTYVSNPEVTVIVQEVRSRKFNVVGEVLRPGSYLLEKPMTVLDGLAMAGGFREFANVKKVYVLRKAEDGSSQRLFFNYKEVIRGKGFGQNVQLAPGDTIVVP